MDIDNEIFRIFQALDSEKQGFIDRNTFLEDLINFLSKSDGIEENTIAHIRQLMEPYSQIGLNEFREIYLKIDKSSREGCDEAILSTGNKTPWSRSSSSCSDVDEKPVRPKLGGTGNTSATRSGRDLLAASRASLQRMIEGPLVQVTQFELEAEGDEAEDPDESRAASDNAKTLQEIRDLTEELAQERRRYETECELHRTAVLRISELEYALLDQEALQRSRTEQARQQHTQELNALRLARDTADMEASARYNLLEQEHSELRGDHENLQLRCQELTDKNESLQREAGYWKSLYHENEAILLDYKAVSSRQVVELQTERNQLEMSNLELYTELQTVKHLAPSETTGITKHYSITERVPASRRPRALSFMGPIGTSSEKRRSTAELPKKSESIESEAGRLVHLLTMENRNLVERIAHLETVGFYQRQKLEAANCLSLAAEMEQLDLEEVKTALSVERETVRSLQRYMTTLTNKLLLAGLIEVFQQ